MSKKKSTPKTSQSRTRQQSDVPLGLRAIMCTLAADDAAEPTHSQWVARNVSAEAVAIVERRGPQYGAQQALPIANRMYPGSDPKPETVPDMVAEAGFWLGVATCWYLITAVNGQGGAR